MPNKTSIDNFMPRVVQNLSSMPDANIVRNALRDAIIELCMSGSFFVRDISARPTGNKIRINGDDAPEEDRDNYLLASVLKVSIDGRQLRNLDPGEVTVFSTRSAGWNYDDNYVYLLNYSPITEDDSPNEYVRVRASVGSAYRTISREQAISEGLDFVEINNGGRSGATSRLVDIVYTLRPRRDATEYDSDFYEKYCSVVAYGALARLSPQFFPSPQLREVALRDWAMQRNQAALRSIRATAERSTANVDGIHRNFRVGV